MEQCEHLPKTPIRSPDFLAPRVTKPKQITSVNHHASIDFTCSLVSCGRWQCLRPNASLGKWRMVIMKGFDLSFLVNANSNL